MDELLIPPSAFLNRSTPINYYKSDEMECAFIPTSRNTERNFHKLNESSQTEWIKTLNKESCTTEQIFSAEDFQSKISAKKSKYLKKLNVVKQKCNDEVSEISKQCEDISRKLFDATREKDSVCEELSKLKFYISGIEDRDAWMKEKQRLTDQINNQQYTISEQQSMIDSLKVQMSSLEKIQSIQEREIHKNIVSICPSQLSEKSKSPNYERLLRVWRHKVLSLLVQQESDSIVRSKEIHHFRQETQELDNQIKHLQCCLEQLNLRFDVQQAQLSTDGILVEKYKRENENLLLKLQSLSTDQEVNKEQMELICRQLDNFTRVIEEEVFVKFDFVSSKIDTFHRRLDYANSRFPMIQANVTRHRNMMGDRRSGDRPEDEEPSGVFSNKIYQLEEALVITNNELKIVRQERDRLIRTLEEDSASFFSRLNEKKDELKEEMENLRTMVSKYENSLTMITKDLELSKQENYRLKADYDILLSSKHSEADNLHSSLKECRAELSRVSQEFADFKRTSAQGKKLLEEQITATEQRLIQCDSHWKKSCDQLAAERDFLKMTIRQEGILSKLKTRTQEDRRPITVKSTERSGLETESLMREVNELTEEFNIDHDRGDY